jgi:diaminopimelate epimerase
MTGKTQIHPFLKMHGLGNDFVILDARTSGLPITSDRALFIANRRRGIGCDQVIVLRPSSADDVFMEIWNADGSRVSACGNATRCVGQLLLDETERDTVSIQTDAGHLEAIRDGILISVNMGRARVGWQDIPVANETATDRMDFAVGPLAAPGCVNMGNPHVVFFTDDAEAIDLAQWGPQIETDPMFPEKANVSVVSLIGNTIRQRVWERGAGITEACGSAACASVVAATRRGLIDRKATVQLDGGELVVEWKSDGHVQMTGPATFVYSGEILL